jgi:hypothetical protein
MSFLVNGTRFGPHHYYRDDDHARRVLWASRENPVLVTGLRRIGKSWFLRRFEQILQAGATRHFGPDVHRAAATAETRFGHAARPVRWVAGAAHGDQGEEYGYAWGALRHDPASGRWQAGWAPRTFVAGQDAMRPDATRYELADDGFAWEDLACPWPAPGVAG